jgi:hypothetical protein
MAVEVNDEENEEFTTPHLPERYHQQVKAKKQRRLKKRLLMAVGAIIIIVILFLMLNWAAGGIFSGIPTLSLHQQPPIATPDTHPQPTGSIPKATNTPNVTDSFTRGPGLAAALPPGVVPFESAVSTLRTDYPAAYYTILTADLTGRSGRFLYEFSIEPVNREGSGKSIAFIDATNNQPYSPGEEDAKISRDEAQHQAQETLPALHPDRTIPLYRSMPEGSRQWDVILFFGSAEIGSVTLDADTGEIISFVKIIQSDGRPSAPAINAQRARNIADRYIVDRNHGLLPLNMSVSRYEPVATTDGPVAGQYTFIYERTFQDFPTDVDGFTVVVDAVTGEVTGYTQQWTTPEHAFSASSDPEIIRREATFAVMQKAKEQYPGNVGGLRIISAEIRWKNKVLYGTVPRPGTIPLAWKVVFDDDIIRANTSAQPSVAWVDVRSGNLIAFDYRH